MADSTTTKYLDDVRSLEILESLTKNLNFNIPNVDFNDDAFKIPASLLATLQKEPTVISKEAVTNIDEKTYTSSNKHTIQGTGSFDTIMSAYMKHLEREFVEKRIQGADYANAYTQLLGQAMEQAINFELNREKSRWEGILSQVQAITAVANLYKAKVELAIAQGQALTTKAQYANAVAQLGNLDAQYGNALAQRDNTVAQTDNIVVQKDNILAQTDNLLVQKDNIVAQTGNLVAQKDNIIVQKDNIVAQTNNLLAQRDNIIAEKDNIVAQTDNLVVQKDNIVAQTNNLLVQKDNIVAQKDNILAQTDKVREDITLTVKQEAMVAQQTTSFKRRDEYNAVKLQADAFTIQKSIDEGTVAPNVFQSAQINTNLSKHLTNVGL